MEMKHGKIVSEEEPQFASGTSTTKMMAILAEAAKQ